MNPANPNSIEFDQLKLRPDIEWIAQPNQSKWIARDPLTGAYFYFSDIEYTAAKMLNAGNAIDAILNFMRVRFPNNDFSRSWFAAFASRLNAAHLLSPNSPRVLQTLTQPKQRSTWQRALKLLAIPLSMRLPLFNPAQLLKRLEWLAKLLFNPFACALVLVVSVVMVALVVGKVLDSGMPLIPDLAGFRGDRWLLLLACYVVVKSIHELGHSLACSRFRVDCQEVGLLFLFFTPCFYCDTTDSWKLRSKWHRAAIAAAGMYVELIIASLAALVWLNTREGTLHTIASSVMIVCSVGTLLINANPFLRYDGYYILSDLWGVPNLSEQSRDALWSLFTSWISGQRAERAHLDANIFALAAFAIASAAYRTVLAGTILWLAWTSLVPYGLGFVAINIGLVYLVGFMVMAVRIIKSIYRDVVQRSAFRFSRVVLMFTSVIVVVAFLLEVPIATFVTARAVSDFADKVPLFAPVTSELTAVASTSQELAAEQNLLRFSTPDKLIALESVRGELALSQLKLQQLESRSAIDEAVTFEIPSTREVVADLAQKESLLREEVASLNINATATGYLIPAEYQLPQPLVAQNDNRIDLSPIAEGNLGCTIERGTLVAWYTAREKPILTAVVAQENVRLLSVGMEATCRWDAELPTTQTGTIIRISPEPITELPTALQGDNYLISLRNASGKLLPDVPHYEVTIELPSNTPPHLKGSVASVRFKIASRTIFESVMRYIRLSFKPVY